MSIALKSGTHPASSIEKYYRFHAHIYDITRWSFLFGRTAILREVSMVARPTRILEVGCGTGKNLLNLCRYFPDAQVTGVDLSESMLDVAFHKTASLGTRVRLIHGSYDRTFQSRHPFDMILFSYALTMFDSGFSEAITTAYRDLSPGGHIAVVDFHDTHFGAFERWMGMNHVRMNGQLHQQLTTQFHPRSDRILDAYGGIWRYLLFVGQKQAE